MKQSRAEGQRAAAALLELAELVYKDFAALDQALIDSHPGYPTSTIGGGGGRGGDVSRPTERYALEDNPASKKREALYEAIDAAHRWMREAEFIRTQYLPAMSMVKRCNNPVGCPGFRLAERDRGGLCRSCWDVRPRASEAA